MGACVSRLCLVLLLVLLGSQFGFFSPDDHLPMTQITWQDMTVNENLGRLGVYGAYNSSRVIVVSKDGTGDSDTVQGALDMVPQHNRQRVKILLRPGIYRYVESHTSLVGFYFLLDEHCNGSNSTDSSEKVYIPKSKPYISFIGNQRSQTVITWHDKASDRNPNGEWIGTYDSASVTIAADYFCATGITFQNTVVAVPGGYGMQAVALRITGEKAMFYRARFVGAQDTLLDETGTHYFYQCYIEGTVDFIFGNGRSLYKDCYIHSTARSSGAIAASRRDKADEDTGFSFVNCTIHGTGHIFLGRTWGAYSRAIFSYCDIDDIITPEGWSDWGDEARRETAVVGEYKCRGRGAHSRRRVPWAKSFSYEEVKPFLDMNYIHGDEWLRL